MCCIRSPLNVLNQTITILGTVNCTVDHAQYADSVKKSISALSHTAVCRLQNKVQCLYNFRLTQSINYLISAHYTSVLRLY